MVVEFVADFPLLLVGLKSLEKCTTDKVEPMLNKLNSKMKWTVAGIVVAVLVALGASGAYATEPSLRSGFLGLEVVRVPAPIGLTML